MGAGSTWGELILDDETDMWITLSDIKDYFYALGIPVELSAYFCLPDVPASLVKELEAAQYGPKHFFADLEPSLSVAPALTVLPMGFSWSFFFAQLVHIQSVYKALPWEIGAIIQDRLPPPRFGRGTRVALA